MIIHIPHSSREIPRPYRAQFDLDDAALAAEISRATDWYTDELFECDTATAVIFPVSRILVDVERFTDDRQEPMARVGRGVLYTHTVEGRPMRAAPDGESRTRLVHDYYAPHHLRLTHAVDRELEVQGRTLIVDGHSFPDTPWPIEMLQNLDRPDICIGCDEYHTPAVLVAAARDHFQSQGYSVDINRPYAGALVPLKYYQVDRRVQSIMIEVNRRLYLDEATGAKTSSFEKIRNAVRVCLDCLDNTSRGAA
jgi:N-formylglutamate amidohydrolase